MNKKKTLKRWGLHLIVWIVKRIVSLRYQVHFQGLENLTQEKLSRPGGILFLPNHPAEMDPVILMIALWESFHLRPLVVEHFYYLNGFIHFMRLVDALPLPTMDIQASHWRAKQVEKMFAHILEGLKKKENFLIYPSGRIKLTGAEVLGGASLVHNLLSAYPDVNIVLVRTTGFWGSSFSRALTGQVPSFGKTLWKGFKVLLKNGIFFAPRRPVKLEFEIAPKDFPYTSSRLDLNKYLENWYNRYPVLGPEPLTLISYSFYKEDLPKINIKEESKIKAQKIPVPDKIEQAILSHLAELAKRPLDQIEKQMHLAYDLGLDSLDLAQLYVFLDETFDISGLVPGELQTVEDLLQAAAGLKKEPQEPEKKMKSSPQWLQEKERKAPASPSGSTIQEAFLKSCQRMKNSIACADHLTEAVSYRKLKRSALILSLMIRTLPGDYIGILLPSSVGVYVSILACLLAKKTPVMLNWTAGKRSLDHAVGLLDLRAVISSKRFVSRKEIGELGLIEDLFVLLEEVRGKISWKDKMYGMWLASLGVNTLLSQLHLKEVKAEDAAVILFTSGTEALPKAVPLSHHNLLSNERAALSCIELKNSDIFYGVLPPFHSFGFSVTGLLPLLAGLKVFYAPDPNDSHGLAHDIAEWNITLFCCAPSFIRAMMRVADPSQLTSLRYLVSGAEKTPRELFEQVSSRLPHTQMIEGYGITECGPIVTVNHPYDPQKGVGRPVPGVELCVIDSVSGQRLEMGKEGEICIRGPNVFKGYLGNVRCPFISIDNEEWYCSGDRGWLESDGSLILSGRLKRFVKIGGEMLSLGGLEEELVRLNQERKWSHPSEEGPTLAISVREKQSDKPLLVLFTTFDVSKEEINAALKEGGFGRIVKISEVQRLEQIPLTGTGKTHYRLLDEMLNNSAN